MDQEGEEVAKGSYNLADVIQQQDGNLSKAEMLARESLRIRSLIYSSDDYRMGWNCSLLARILESQGKLEDETKRLLGRSSAIFIRNEGPDGANPAIANYNIGRYYYELARRQPTVKYKEEIFFSFEVTYRGRIL
jgi:hypothetical protein